MGCAMFTRNQLTRGGVWGYIVGMEDRVYSVPSALDLLAQEDPLGVLTKSALFEERLARLLGIDLSELRSLERQGVLERHLSTHYYAVAMKALEEIAGAISSGDCPPELLLNIADRLARTAHKLSGREVQKHLFLSEDRLLELLQTETESPGEVADPASNGA